MEYDGKAMDKALLYLTYRDHSTHEVEKYLLSKGFDAATVSAVIAKLNEYGYLNDDSFTKQVVDANLVTKGVGKSLVKRKLLQYGINKETIDATLASTDEHIELENARKWAIKLLPKIDGDLRKKKEKLYRRLVAKGFGYDCIHTVLNDIFNQEESLDE